MEESKGGTDYLPQSVHLGLNPSTNQECITHALTRIIDGIDSTQR